MGNAKQSKAVAYLRQICCSGLGSDLVIPEFLRALHQVIPSGRNWYSAVDVQFNCLYQVPDYVIPEMEQMTEIVSEAFMESFPKITQLYAEWYRYNLTLTDQRLLYKNYFKESFYNLVWRPLEQHYLLEFCVKQHNQVVGLVNLLRPRLSNPFNAQEEALAVQLAPYVAHALAAQGNDSLVYADSGEAGMLVLDNTGTIQYLSEAARHLLFLSKYPEFDVKNHPHDDLVTAQLLHMCRNLTAIFEDKAAPPPRWSHSNRHGRFNFRAYWLNRQQVETGGLIGITIERQEPLMLKLLRVLQNAPLSPAQKEVALLLAQGCSNDQIGKRLHIKLTTVKDHVSKIFAKLDLNSRDELLPKLLTMANTKDGLRECGFSFDLGSPPRNFH
jgi:DNA-binding CsgD family transcriptional regulator